MKIKMCVCYEVAYPMAEFMLDFCDGPVVCKYSRTTAGFMLDSNKVS